MVWPLVMMAGGALLNGYGEQQGANAMADVQNRAYRNTMRRQQTMRDLIGSTLPKFGAGGMEAGINDAMRPAQAATADVGAQSGAFLRASDNGGSPAMMADLSNGVQNQGDQSISRALNTARAQAPGVAQQAQRMTLADLMNRNQMLNDEARIEAARLPALLARAGRKGNTLRTLGGYMNMAGGAGAQSAMWQDDPNDPTNQYLATQRRLRQTPAILNAVGE